MGIINKNSRLSSGFFRQNNPLQTSRCSLRTTEQLNGLIGIDSETNECGQTDKQIIQLIESKKADELDVEFEGISEPKMDITSYDDLKKILVDSLLAEA